MVIGAWLRSKTHREYKAFIEKLADSIKSKNNDYRKTLPKSPTTDALLSLLSQLNTWVDETENELQEKGNARFGNPAFRTWYELLSKNAVSLCETVLSAGTRFEVEGLEGVMDADILKNAAEEISVYLLDSFGTNWEHIGKQFENVRKNTI